MSTLAIDGPRGLLVGIIAPSAGDDGNAIARKTANAVWSLKSAVNAGSSLVFNDLAALEQECDDDTRNCQVFELAKKFLLALPSSLQAPELAVDSDGEVVFDWIGPSKRMLTVTLRGDGRVSYAARMSSIDKDYGTKSFADAVPEKVLELVRQVTQT